MSIVVPARAVHAPGEAVVVDLEPAAPAACEAVVTYLAEEVARVQVHPGQSRVELGTFPVGGYGVTVGQSTTAFDVLEDRWARPRYGFVATLDGSVPVPDVQRTFRRFHLSAAQLYDWAYRHSTLLPPQDVYLDPLGQQRDLRAISALAGELSAVGVEPLGYVAVYAIGADEVSAWADALLLRPDGEPYRLGEDFLVLVDPGHERWRDHLLGQLEQVVERTAIRGFHLDQYGWPKVARRGDGAPVDLAASFTGFLESVRERLPEAPFMFNNVNDFPTHATATAPQSATYIEVWDPHTTLRDLGELASRARQQRPEHPPILSAYLSCYVGGPEESATRAAMLVLATAASHGATHLLLGEDGHALTDPYYPRNHTLAPESVEALVPWYDFVVRYGDLLHDPAAVDVTRHYTGGINEDVVVHADGLRVGVDPEAGALWTRVVRTPLGWAVHLINLRGQHDTVWDAPKAPVEPVVGARIRLSFADEATTVRAASPELPDLVRLEPLGHVRGHQDDALSAGQGGVEFELPPLGLWTVVWIS